MSARVVSPMCLALPTLGDKLVCTLVILYRPGHSWPLLAAANRDERLDRAWRAPGRHWPQLPEVVAGLDEFGGGSWLGVNDAGVLAAVMNRTGSLGPAPDKQSRGQLVLQALQNGSAAMAAAALTGTEPDDYRAFNLLVADATDAFWLRHSGEAGAQRVDVVELPPGICMLTDRDCNDRASARVATYLPRFQHAPPPEPGRGDWQAWESLLGDHTLAPADDPQAAMFIVPRAGFGTVSSSLIALPSAAGPRRSPIWRFAAATDEAFTTVVF